MSAAGSTANPKFPSGARTVCFRTNPSRSSTTRWDCFPWSTWESKGEGGGLADMFVGVADVGAEVLDAAPGDDGGLPLLVEGNVGEGYADVVLDLGEEGVPSRCRG